MKALLCVAFSATLLVVLTGCSPVVPWPFFYPADYSPDQMRDVPSDKIALLCQECGADAESPRVCAGIHPLKRPPYCEGRTPDGSPAVLIPVQFSYTNASGKTESFPIFDVRLAVAGETMKPNGYYTRRIGTEHIPDGETRTLNAGFVVAEKVIKRSRTLIVTCPCPGDEAQHLDFEFVALEPEHDDFAGE